MSTAPSRHTLVHQLADWATRTPDRPAIFGKEAGEWRHRTWAQFWADVRRTARGLIALGHEAGEPVALIGDNRMEWVIFQHAIMACGGMPAPIYTTNTPVQVAYIVEQSGARIAVCDGAAQLDKFDEAQREGWMSVEHVVTMDHVRDDTPSLAALMELGAGVDDEALDERIAALDGETTALLIYTSGTTGQPKGVMLDHGGLVAVQGALIDRLAVFRREPYRMVSYLPLCHAAEQMLTTVGSLATGGQVYFCADIKNIRDALLDVRPTLFLGVPRVWEKFEAALRARLGEQTGIRARLATWAQSTELAAYQHTLKTGDDAHSLARRAANKIVLDKVKTQLGLDQLRAAVTGSAPIGVSTLEFFGGLGIRILDAYGLSETTAVSHISLPQAPRPGTVGPPLKGVEMRISDEGEVQLRGRTMTRGYHRLPEKTAALFTDDGWLKTGDIGEIDPEGNLKITGRIKDLIITAGGKNIAPVELESYLQQIDGIGQAVVVGDRRPYLAALLTLDPEALPRLAETYGVSATPAALASCDAFRQAVEAAVESTCNAKVARVQQVKRVRVLDVEFSPERGELTPTMKIRRNVINERFAANIDAIYGGPLQAS